MQIIKSFRFKWITCLTMAVLGLGLAGCASHPGRTHAQYKSDNGTSKRVTKALHQSDIYKYPDVTVGTFNSTVTLGGYIDTYAQKQGAVDLARNTFGVREVIDNMTPRLEPTGRVPVINSAPPIPAPKSQTWPQNP